MNKLRAIINNASLPLKASVSTAVLATVLSPVSFAQQGNSALTESNVVASEEQPNVSARQVKEADSGVEEVVVTGSRLKRDTFSSIAPLQIIDTEGAREAGAIDTSSILQTSGAASGQQIDLTFSGYVLDNGPGSATVDLRGLGAGRTLVLLNGRRLAPAGVEGAPVAADLNLIPSSLVQRYDMLLDGASSIYGSDAVAGVTNIILKKDFEGVDFEVFSKTPQQGNGEEITMSLSWGKNFDRGFFGIGAEHFTASAVTLADREWTDSCERNVEVGTDGKIYHSDAYYSTVLGMDMSDGCAVGLLAGRVSVPVAGSIYYSPSGSQGAWPGFAESNLFGFGVDADGDGVTDVNFRNHDINGNDLFAHLYPEQERTSIMTYGEYTFEGDMNLTPFYEASYAKRETYINAGALQLFPSVPGANPFNICNPDGVRGVDCGLAYDALLDDPEFVAQFVEHYGATPADYGLHYGALGPQSAQPIVSVYGDRNTGDVEVSQMRFVTGLRGDLPMLNVGSLSDWSFELSGSITKSEGKSHRYGIRDDRLTQSLNTTREDPNNPGTYICDPLPGESTCVPVDMFADSLYEGVVGDFATQAERDYLFDSRDFDTSYYQSIFSAYASGTVATLPAGDVIVGVGAELRNDRIKSLPDDVARDGLFFGFFSDGGATGSKDTKEAFAEVELPLISGKFMAEELTTNLSARYTKDEFYGGAWTNAAKIAYRPVESLLLRSTYGTSYRAPNLRENFLKNQTGFPTVFDPCLIPEAALDPISGGYNAALDTRSPEVLTNCAANGVDPTVVHNNGFNNYSVESSAGGNLNLKEETSDSYTVGFSFEQPFFDDFDLTLGMTYYDIEIENSIIEPSPQFLINDCYTNPNGNSAFCSQLNRDEDGMLSLINAGFVNRDSEVARGFDYNLRYTQPVTFFGAPLELSANLTFNRVLERTLTYVSEDGTPDVERYHGTFGFPEWNARGEFRIDYDKYRFTWTTRYLGAVEQDDQYLDEFSDIYDTNNTGFISDTCIGSANGGIDCRDVGFADDYMVHSASLYYYADTWTAGLGVSNVFNEAPPQVNGDEITSINNTPIGYGYDLQGRTMFLNLQKNF
ncbi:TonB-dependent receptor domain-containing protein [Microbulbifer harenosus]|uniref:TonB-dependent receptor n=1 Tax=Microbulbifer harenosus TaxID=2576840 RepID=A0ABY2UKW2_9GAMM|nr:TonB-dependent receptor [Microbulbifer harenosus]TLM79076.1 TonB-dependent receptor [Microbulbifer harenosus]